MTFNIHHGSGIDGKTDIKRIADIIKQSDADIVALQEVDRWVPRSEKLDMISALSDLTGMTYAYGKNDDLDGGESGNAILTRFPILEEKNLTLNSPGPGKEYRIIELVLDVRGTELVFINTELDGAVDDSVRITDVAKIQDAARERQFVPVIVCGSFNAEPLSRGIASFTGVFQDCWNIAGSGQGFTYPASLPQMRADYVFVSKSQAPTDSKTLQLGLKVVSAEVLTTTASDHLPLVVYLKIVSE